MRSSHHMRAIACLLLTGALAGCDAGPQDLTRPDTVETEVRGENGPSALDIRASLEDSWSFAPPVFGIGTAPNGNILVPETVFPGSPATETTIVEVRRQGKGGTQTFNTVSTVAGSPIQDVAAVGRGSLWLASGGLDLAVGAGVWHVTPRQARQVGDVETFEITEDPDAVFWKDPACEAVDGFSAGPQSNPYRVVPLPDGRMLVADAAGNSVLVVEQDGSVDWKAVLTPPVADGGSSDDPADWMVRFSIDELPCYVQPVATAAAVGPNGYHYVGELTGALALADGLPVGLSRIWRLDPDAEHALCPSDDCEMVLSGFTSVVGMEFGPDGSLYVAEMDENSWLASIGVVPPAGATINRCDVDAGTCAPVGDVGAFALVGDIAFDGWGDLWVLENGLSAPTVSRVPLD